MPEGPHLGRGHYPNPVMTVMSTKGAGTARPFVRISPTDLTLYQALVDVLAPYIEGALLDRNSAFAYRQSLTNSENAFEGTPRWADFMSSIRTLLENGWYSHALISDITSYFVYINIEELERKLLASGAPSDVTHDLHALLAVWQGMGVRGLPQGIPCSSPLGNFYLSGLDELLRGENYEFRRYMDDLWVFTFGYSEARRVQDLLERELYRLRLSLGGEKSRILRNETALEETRMAKERIELRAEAIASEVLETLVDTYADEFVLPDPAEIDAVAVMSEYDEIIHGVRGGNYPEALRPRLTEIYRQLEALGETAQVSDVPEILQRFPDLTGPALRYAAHVAGGDIDVAVETFLKVLDNGRFHRDQEFLLIFRAVLWLPNGCSEDLADVLSDYSKQSATWLLRARALLGWGAHSLPHDFSAADEFWTAAGPGWRGYALVAIQNKNPLERDARYEQWSGEGRFLRNLADSIKEQPFQWRQI